MAYGIYKVTEEFEQALADYTGAKYAVTVDNASNALFLAMKYEILANFSDKGDNIGKFLYIILTFGKSFFIFKMSLCAFLQYEQL